MPKCDIHVNYFHKCDADVPAYAFVGKLRILPPFKNKHNRLWLVTNAPQNQRL